MAADIAYLDIIYCMDAIKFSVLFLLDCLGVDQLLNISPCHALNLAILPQWPKS